MAKKINKKLSIDLCVVPELLSAYSISGKTVVVVDVLRATSTIITALAHGVKQFVVTDSLEKCLALGDLGFVTAGERQGEKLPGCQLGNSPQEFTSDLLRGEKIALTSTNGTEAILAAREASVLLLGAFLNLSALVKALKQQQQPALVLCAGRQGRLSVEDTLLAGALYESLKALYTPSDDIRLAGELYASAKSDPIGFLAKYEHTKRLQDLGAGSDIAFCLQKSRYKLVPYYSRGYIEAQTASSLPTSS